LLITFGADRVGVISSVCCVRDGEVSIRLRAAPVFGRERVVRNAAGSPETLAATVAQLGHVLDANLLESSFPL